MVSSNRVDSPAFPGELPGDISYYCSADLDEVLYPDRKQESRNNQPTVDGSRTDQILYTNPQDFLDILPPEVILEILKYLDVRSLMRASQTCRRWQNFIKNDSWLWEWFCRNCYDVAEDVHMDRNQGYDWQVIFQRCVQHHRIRRKWLNGEFSNISNAHSLPQRTMTCLTRDEWGTILTTELLRRA